MSTNMVKKAGSRIKKNTLEVLDELRSSTVKQTTSEFKKIGSGILEDLLAGGEYSSPYERRPQRAQEEQKPQPKIEGNIFNFAEHRESEMVTSQIKELMSLIHQEMEVIDRQNSSLLSEVNDIQKLTVDSMPEKVGIYHVRFLETVLSILRTLREKISDSGTWLAAMTSKKSKRGSLFATRSKNMGTQYSLSQELQATRSIQ